MDIFLVNSDHPHTKSLCKKLAEKTQDGAIIPLNTQEMDLYCSRDFQHITYGDDQNPNFTEVESGGSYVFVANQDVNIEDIMNLEELLSIKVGIIRTIG